MTEVPAPGAPGGGGWRVTRNVLRGVLGAALIVLVVLIVMRFTGQGAQVLAAPTETPVAGESATPVPAPTIPVPTPAPIAPGGSGGSGGGGSGGGGSGGGGGGGTAPPATPAPQFTGFSATSSVECPYPTTPVPDGFEPEPVIQTPPIVVEWSSTGAVQAWIGADTTDAQAEPYSEVDPSGSFETQFFCPDDSITWTVTLLGADGATVSQTATIVNSGYAG